MHLFDIEPKAKYNFSTQGANFNLFGDKYIEVPNEPDGMIFNYWVKECVAASGARITITDISGRQVAQLNGPARAGIQSRAVEHDRLAPPAGARAPGRRDAVGRWRSVAAAEVWPRAPGDYLVTLEIGAEKVSKVGRVRERIWKN